MSETAKWHLSEDKVDVEAERMVMKTEEHVAGAVKEEKEAEQGEGEDTGPMAMCLSSLGFRKLRPLFLYFAPSPSLCSMIYKCPAPDPFYFFSFP